MCPQKSKLHKIIMDNKLVHILNSRVTDYASPNKLSKKDVVVSGLTLSQQWSLPKEECVEQLNFSGKPCSESCVCYTHALVNAVLEVITDGPRSDEASTFLEQEYLYNADQPKFLH